MLHSPKQRTHRRNSSTGALPQNAALEAMLQRRQPRSRSSPADSPPPPPPLHPLSPVVSETAASPVVASPTRVPSEPEPPATPPCTPPPSPLRNDENVAVQEERKPRLGKRKSPAVEEEVEVVPDPRAPGPSAPSAGVASAAAAASDDGVEFVGNFARRGGAVYVEQNTLLLIAHAHFEANTARDSGGGLYLAGAGDKVDDDSDSKNSTLMASVVWTVFLRNVAGNDGSALMEWSLSS